MRYQLRIVDTERHSFKHVIWALTKVFGFEVEHALLKVKEAHAVGDAVVFTSHFELVEFKQEQLAAFPQPDAGPIVTIITEVRDGVRS